MGYIARYDTHYNDQTGEWLEKIGFCDDGTCTFCDAFEEDGRPETALVAIQEVGWGKLDNFPW